MSATFPWSARSLADIAPTSAPTPWSAKSLAAIARAPLGRQLPAALPVTVNMVVKIWNVEHGACAMVYPTYNGVPGHIAMIDAGCRDDWHPSIHLRYAMNRTELNYLFVQNADQDHLSDLQGLSDYGVNVSVLHRAAVSPLALRAIKLLECGETTGAFDQFASMCQSYTAPVAQPFNTSMGGMTYSAFHNEFRRFTDTNNLSLALFFKFGGFKILFGGDLERDGWLALLEKPAFRAELLNTNIFVASHHGRENGFCRELFDYFAPSAVVMSDKAMVHETQEMGDTYRGIVRGGIVTRGSRSQRFVLTTRCDGHITFTVVPFSHYSVDLEHD